MDGVLRLRMRERRLNRLTEKAGVLDVFDDAPTGREADFERKTARDLHKERVERADSQTMQRTNDVDGERT